MTPTESDIEARHIARQLLRAVGATTYAKGIAQCRLCSAPQRYAIGRPIAIDHEPGCLIGTIESWPLLAIVEPAPADDDETTA